MSVAKRPTRNLGWWAASLLGVIACVAAGCGTGDGDPDAPECASRQLSTSTPVPPEVDTILEARCQRCHSDPPQQFAPLPLVDWEDFQRPRSDTNDEPVYRTMERRINDEKFPMPPIREPQLSAEERQVLTTWAQQCAPPAGD